MSVRGPWLAAAISIFCGLDCCPGAETFESLAARIPAEANALVLIDVEQTLRAPLAQEQGWAKNLETAYVERPVFLPPEARKLALGASLQPSRDFLAAWEVAVMDLAEPPAVRSIARAESGYVDQMNGLAAAITPQNAAFVDLGKNVLGVVRPADRQFVARWTAAAGDASQSKLSPYLQAALPKVSDRVQVLLAVDLTDVLGPHDIEGKLTEASWLAAEQADVGAIAKVLATLRGAVLRVAVGKECQGQLQIDFDADVAPLGEHAKPLVLRALRNLGLQTDELSKWDVTLTSRSIQMQGLLSRAVQRRVFSVIELPAADLSAQESSAGVAGQPSENVVRDRSLTYFAATQVRVRDVRESLQDVKTISVALMEQSARSVDELPVLNVDDELLVYGDKLAETLRIMSVSKSQARIRGGVRREQSTGVGYYGYSGVDERARITKEESGSAQDTLVTGMKLIDDATADIRRTLTKKYGVEF